MTTSSPSTPTHATVTCGVPSGSRVATVASAAPFSMSLASSGILIPLLGGRADGVVHDVEALVQQGLVDRERWEQADHIVVGPRFEDHDPLAQAALDDAGSGGTVERLLGLPVHHQLDRRHHPPAPDVADQRVPGLHVAEPGQDALAERAGP